MVRWDDWMEGSPKGPGLILHHGAWAASTGPAALDWNRAVDAPAQSLSERSPLVVLPPVFALGEEPRDVLHVAPCLAEALDQGAAVAVALPCFGGAPRGDRDYVVARSWSEELLSALTGFRLEARSVDKARLQLARQPVWFPCFGTVAGGATNPARFDPVFSVPLAAVPKASRATLLWNYSALGTYHSSLFWRVGRGRVEIVPYRTFDDEIDASREQLYVAQLALRVATDSLDVRLQLGEASSRWREWPERHDVTELHGDVLPEVVPAARYEVVIPGERVAAEVTESEALRVLEDHGIDLVVDLVGALRLSDAPCIALFDGGRPQKCRVQKTKNEPSLRECAKFLAAWIRAGSNYFSLKQLGSEVWSAFVTRHETDGAGPSPLSTNDVSKRLTVLRKRLTWCPFLEPESTRDRRYRLKSDRAMAVIDRSS